MTATDKARAALRRLIARLRQAVSEPDGASVLLAMGIAGAAAGGVALVLDRHILAALTVAIEVLVLGAVAGYFIVTQARYRAWRERSRALESMFAQLLEGVEALAEGVEKNTRRLEVNGDRAAKALELVRLNAGFQDLHHQTHETIFTFHELVADHLGVEVPASIRERVVALRKQMEAFNDAANPEDH